jgi:hypothetical protein
LWSCSEAVTTLRRRNPRETVVTTTNIIFSTRCPCGAQFCYTCGQKWHTCSCPQWDENRLYDRAAQIVERNPRWQLFNPPRQEHEQLSTRPNSPLLSLVSQNADVMDNAIPPSETLLQDDEEQFIVSLVAGGASNQAGLASEGHQRILRTMQNLREYHACSHRGWKHVRGVHQCEECMHFLPEYIFECRQCALHACNRCRRNRL